MMNVEREEIGRRNMIVDRLRILWVIIQETHPDKPFARGEGQLAVPVQRALRSVSRKKALAEFQPLFNDLMGGERVASIDAGPIDWGD